MYLSEHSKSFKKESEVKTQHHYHVYLWHDGPYSEDEHSLYQQKEPGELPLALSQ